MKKNKSEQILSKNEIHMWDIYMAHLWMKQPENKQKLWNEFCEEMMKRRNKTSNDMIFGKEVETEDDEADDESIQD